MEITPDYLQQLIANKKNEGYTFVSLDAIISNKSRFRRKQINISFDDGFKDVYDFAFPILKKEQIPFTLFLTTGMPNHTAHMWWLQLEQLVRSNNQFEKALKEIYDSGENMCDYFCKKYNVEPDLAITVHNSLTWEQIKEMVNSGLCMIGSHTDAHDALTRIAREDVLKELQLSKQIIKQKLGVDPLYFSYPHSMANADVQNLVHDAGYTYAFMGYGGAIRKGDNLYHLNRQHIIQP